MKQCVKIAVSLFILFILVPGAEASSGCKEYQYAIYHKQAVQSVSVGIKWNTVSLKGGFVSAWIGPLNSTGTVWIQTGLSRDDPKYGREGLYKYIEWNYPGVYSIVDKGDAKAGTVYKAVITKVKNGVWTASIGGSALGKNVKPSGMNTTEFAGESYRSGKGTCQLMDVNFSSSTWKTSTMEKHQDKPYSLKSPGSNSWHAVGS